MFAVAMGALVTASRSWRGTWRPRSPRACWCWPTAGSPRTRCFPRSPPPARTCAGGPRTTRRCRCWSASPTGLTALSWSPARDRHARRHRAGRPGHRIRPRRPGTARRRRRYRLITTISDPDEAPAAELAALYAERWEFGTALDEIKTHQRGPRAVLRSKSPGGVRQEAYGYLCTHYAIRALMAARRQRPRHRPGPDLLHPRLKRRPPLHPRRPWRQLRHPGHRTARHHQRDLPPAAAPAAAARGAPRGQAQDEQLRRQTNRPPVLATASPAPSQRHPRPRLTLNYEHWG